MRSTPESREQNSSRNELFLRQFTTNEPAIRAYVRRLVPSQSDADDILQEVAIVLWNRFDDFRLDGDFRTWAYGIAKFKVLSWMRDQKRDKLMLANDVMELVAEDAERVDPQLQRQRELLEHCFQKVAISDRELLARAYQPDAVIQEVALSSGRTVPGFYQWLYRMRQLLLNCIQRELAREALS
ncbi:sigma-70 family RNA polymerase sigma factor [Planctomicrobium sp. SH661]|uniref:sigma-70 family RNA polymerase sigma factor n=1 Tax=Planctomicrobium sp. SH661 TaxID=3448124 RepID=UPI003F5AFBC6